MAVSFAIGRSSVLAFVIVRLLVSLPALHWRRAVASRGPLTIWITVSLITRGLLADLSRHGAISLKIHHLLSISGAVLAHSLLSRAHPALLPLMMIAPWRFCHLVVEVRGQCLVISLSIIREVFVGATSCRHGLVKVAGMRAVV